MPTAAPDHAAPPALLPDAWVVRETLRETADVTTLVLEPGPGARPFAFAPGQFNMLYVFGVGEVPISMSGDPADTGRLVHTIRDVGPVTRALCAATPGDIIGVRGPFGRPWPIAADTVRDVVIVAGGIGLAPLRPVLHHVLSYRDRYDDVVLLVGARRPEELLFPSAYDTWRRAGIHVVVTVDRASADWTGHVGVVPTLVRFGRFDAAEATAFVCGPEVMMRFTARALEERGVSPARIWVSMERNMKCAIGLCGHCQLGPAFICTDGPVFTWPRMRPLMEVRER